MAKKNVSEIERGAGYFQGLVTGIMDIAREKGVPFEAVYRLATAGGRTTLGRIVDLAYADWQAEQPKEEPMPEPQPANGHPYRTAPSLRQTQGERVSQAKILWDKGFGRESGFDSFDAYLATVPEIPEDLRAEDERFPLLVLVDGRLGLTAACRLAGLAYRGSDSTLESHDSSKAKSGIRWMRCQDGKRNLNRSIRSCRESFVRDGMGLDAIEGVALFVHHPEALCDHCMDLPNAVLAGFRDCAACLGRWIGKPKLDWGRDAVAVPFCGSGSRRE